MLAKDSYSSDEPLRNRARTAVAFLKEGSERDPSLEMPWTPTRVRTDTGDEFAGVGEEWTPDLLPDLVPMEIEHGVALVSRTSSITAPGLPPRRRRSAADDATEAERRHRRREAIVLHD